MLLKHTLLAVLVRQEQTGYDIAHKIGESIGFFGKPLISKFTKNTVVARACPP